MSRKFSKTILTGILALCLVGGVAPMTAQAAGKSSPNDKVDSAQTIFDLVNNFRASKGLNKLKSHPGIDKVAYDWAKKMSDSHKMVHNPNVGKQYPKGWRSWGENIAYTCGGGTSIDFKAKQLHDMWLDSPGHYRNIVNPKWNVLGVGTYYNAKNDCLWAVQNFGTYNIYNATQKSTVTVTSKVSATYKKKATKTITVINKNGIATKKKVSKTFKATSTGTSKAKVTKSVNYTSYLSAADAKSQAKSKATKSARDEATKKSRANAKKAAENKAKKSVNKKIAAWKKTNNKQSSKLKELPVIVCVLHPR